MRELKATRRIRLDGLAGEVREDVGRLEKMWTRRRRSSKK